MTSIDLSSFIRDVPDFPQPGILFKDITPLLRDPRALERACELLAEPFAGERINMVAGIESRGFIFGSIVARNIGAGFVPIRKPGKLPWTTRRHEYVLEYGSDALEVHDDAFRSGDRVLLIDDLLATGGTLGAAMHLIRGFDAKLVGVATVIELTFLSGREKIDSDIPIHTVLQF